MLIDSRIMHPTVFWVSSAAVDAFQQARGRSVFDWIQRYQKQSMDEKGSNESREATIVHLERGFRRYDILFDSCLDLTFSNLRQAV